MSTPAHQHTSIVYAVQPTCRQLAVLVNHACHSTDQPGPASHLVPPVAGCAQRVLPGRLLRLRLLQPPQLVLAQQRLLLLAWQQPCT